MSDVEDINFETWAMVFRAAGDNSYAVSETLNPLPSVQNLESMLTPENVLKRLYTAGMSIRQARKFFKSDQLEVYFTGVSNRYPGGLVGGLLEDWQKGTLNLDGDTWGEYLSFLPAKAWNGVFNFFGNLKQGVREWRHRDDRPDTQMKINLLPDEKRTDREFKKRQKESKKRGIKLDQLPAQTSEQKLLAEQRAAQTPHPAVQNNYSDRGDNTVTVHKPTLALTFAATSLAASLLGMVYTTLTTREEIRNHEKELTAEIRQLKADARDFANDPHALYIEIVPRRDFVEVPFRNYLEVKAMPNTVESPKDCLDFVVNGMHPKVEDAARAITSYAGETDAEKVRAIVEYAGNIFNEDMRDSQMWHNPPKQKMPMDIRYPLETLVDDAGSNADIAVCMAAMFRSVGLKTALIYFPETDKYSSFLAAAVSCELPASSNAQGNLKRVKFPVGGIGYSVALPGYELGVVPEELQRACTGFEIK